MIQYKAKKDTNPSKLASAIAHHVGQSDIEITGMGEGAVNAMVKAFVIAKKYTQNEDFKLSFDFDITNPKDEEDNELTVIHAYVSSKK